MNFGFFMIGFMVVCFSLGLCFLIASFFEKDYSTTDITSTNSSTSELQYRKQFLQESSIVFDDDQ